MTKRNKWTEEEILFLKNNYEKIGAKKTNEILSGHTYNSIIKIAHTLNLKVDRSTYDINQLKNIVENSISYAEVFRKLNKISTGSSYKILKNTIKKHKIDTSHFDPYKNNRINIKQKPISFWLQNGTNIHSSHLKNKLYKEGLKIKKCEKCGQDENWHGEHMSLILDHINGIPNDNRLENLRILCPNCNATLPTHCRGSKRQNVKKYIKKDRNKNGLTDKEINRNLTQRKVERPPYQQLKNEIDELGYRGTGRKYGVSDNCVRKWYKNATIE